MRPNGFLCRGRAGEYSNTIVICESNRITIFGATRLHWRAHSLKRKDGGVHLAAVYSAFAVIAAVVFGTLSVHPF
jgi:hypothetical protein